MKEKVYNIKSFEKEAEGTEFEEIDIRLRLISTYPRKFDILPVIRIKTWEDKFQITVGIWFIKAKLEIEKYILPF